MKLTSVEIHPENSEAVAVLSFRDPRATNPYNVKAIVGLDVDEIVPKFYGGSGGSKFYDLSLQKRDVVIKVGLNPSFSDSQSYSDLRDDLYRMIASSRTGKIQLQFKNGDEAKAAISGFVSKIEAPLFEKTQEIQITISCSDSMPKALEPIVVEPGDAFWLNPANTIIQDEESTAPHGFSFMMIINANFPSIIITNPDDLTWSFEVVPSGGFQTGDQIFFSSEFNNKYLYLGRLFQTHYLADAITPGSVWPIIFPGQNRLSFTHPTSLLWNTISYYPTYWGV